MSASLSMWLILAALLTFFELLTGTFFLLMLALGCLFAACVAYFSVSISAQIILAICSSLIAIFFLSRWKKYSKKRANDFNMDIGAECVVEKWHQRRARVKYRGSFWDVRLAENEPEDAKYYQIIQTDGNVLVLAKKSSIKK